ncbi:transcriptional regulator WhiB [Mycobacterium kansasii]|uniref:Transcriptional regulator WhiB n=1 Tax=Mycobacterium kansasii TaxID=1768 RepID=A0A7G1INI2_MYCKA|nr:transcriptional regulator WhiB [Mycobacterium kansasii]
MATPCTGNPELWFGYPDDDSGDGAAKARAYERSATEARIQCLRRCPLAQQRLCAERAVKYREEYGVWAGVKLPGASTASGRNWLRLTRYCGGSPPARSMPDNCRRTLLCWHALNATPGR